MPSHEELDGILRPLIGQPLDTRFSGPLTGDREEALASYHLINSFLAVGTFLLRYTLGGQVDSSLLALIDQTPDLSTLATIIHGFPEYAAAVANVTNVTCFAPSNEALARFADAHQDTYQQLFSRLEVFSAIFDIHIVVGAHYSPEFRPGETWFLHTVLTDESVSNVTGGQVVKVRSIYDTLEVSTDAKSPAHVIQKDRCFAGGTLQVIDAVMGIPSSLSSVIADNAFMAASFGQALTAANLSTTLDLQSNLTVLVPSNKAFEQANLSRGDMGQELLAYVLQSHIIPGEVLYSNMLAVGTWTTLSGAKIRIDQDASGIYVNGARIQVEDLLVANGVVHVIDSFAV
ncbi:unnamed protein product [Zymoseptoria tritici ST99CH_3D7]|uniref:FAS1 domain-containing protein n=1 Tax=Zymoseptoria tritici (strain ST99CH_3D7) TaxID=1276538 RepID=A0A1X7RI57_ZYMT9|nr:unnamed protein product [Zymoseptoria tritici ST99CH_3D7]